MIPLGVEALASRKPPLCYKKKEGNARGRLRVEIEVSSCPTPDAGMHCFSLTTARFELAVPVLQQRRNYKTFVIGASGKKDLR